MKHRVAMLICLSATALASAIAPPGIAARGPNSAAAPTLARRAGEGLTTATQDQRKYLGAITCSGLPCHGRSDASDKARSQQTEFIIWSTKDKHHEAFAMLANQASLQMARLLKLDNPPQESDRCLNCHSMNVLDEARRGQDFKIADGVSCDGCHGPAEQWFGTHLNDPYEESVKKGMTDIRNPRVRAEMCLTCHLGNRSQGKIVDHEMIAAGHPALEFELDSFSLRLPPHWREKKPAEDGSNLPRAQNWAAGQLVALRDSLRILAEDARGDRWPEYSQFDCSACHHDLSDDSWRQRRPILRSSGRPAWQRGSLFAFRPSLTNMPGLESAIQSLDRSFARVAFGRADEIAQAVDESLRAVEESVNQSASKPVSADAAREAAKLLFQQAESLAWGGPVAARQLVFALTALLSQALPTDAAAIKTLHQLSQDLSQPGMNYDPSEFIRRIAIVRGQLP